MKHTLFKSLALAAVAGCLAMAPDAQAVFVPSPLLGTESGNDKVEDLIRLTDKDCLEFIYKDNSPGPDEEGQEDLFSTVFGPDANDPTTATLTYTGPAISLYDWDCAFIVVKGGNNFVYYSLSGWDGDEDIQVTNADLPPNRQGIPPGISHVSIYACEGTPTVPEGGTSVALLGLALAGVGAARRFMSRKA
ncbi:MAG: hypothetical protein ACKV19_11075 [Verrucomicrobiales bacterium]